MRKAIILLIFFGLAAWSPAKAQIPESKAFQCLADVMTFKKRQLSFMAHYDPAKLQSMDHDALEEWMKTKSSKKEKLNDYSSARLTANKWSRLLSEPKQRERLIHVLGDRLMECNKLFIIQSSAEKGAEHDWHCAVQYLKKQPDKVPGKLEQLLQNSAADHASTFTMGTDNDRREALITTIAAIKKCDVGYGLPVTKI